jgi:hypothetical protein
MDPRNPKRPDGDAGANWCVCRSCLRGAHHMRDIRHTKACRAEPSPMPVIRPILDWSALLDLPHLAFATPPSRVSCLPLARMLAECAGRGGPGDPPPLTGPVRS